MGLRHKFNIFDKKRECWDTASVGLRHKFNVYHEKNKSVE